MAGRVLVTGGTGAAGGATVKWLRRMGAEVVVLARREPAIRLPGVEYVAADIQNAEAVSRAVAGCTGVAHFAWTVSAMQSAETAEGIDIGGTTNLLRAMADHDCRRMVFASSITVYGGHSDHPQPYTEDETPRPAASFHYERNKMRAEKMILESGLDAVNVRPTVIVGRTAWSAPANIFRQPVVITPGRDARMQLIHVDDVGRFCAEAALGGATGTVNLNAEDALTFTEMGHLVGRPVLNSGERFARTLAGVFGKAPNYESVPDLVELFLNYPLGDTRRLREEFGFTCAYSSADAVADMADTSSTSITVGNRSIRKPTSLAIPVVYPPDTSAQDGASLQIVPPEYTGEFDNGTVDPAIPEWTAANLSEAFPGPMTPFSIGLAMRIMFSGANMVNQLFPLDEDLAYMVSAKQVASIGHRLYNNMTIMKRLANAIPGQSAESFEQQMNGTPLPEGYRAPKMSLAEAVTAAKVAGRAGPQILGLGAEVEKMERRAQQLASTRPDFSTLNDEQLHARLELLSDLVVRSWDVNNMNTFLVGPAITMVGRRYGEAAAMNVRAGTKNLRSAAMLAGVQELGAMVAADEHLRELLTNTPKEAVLVRLRSEAPAFAAKFDSLIADCGHRGPGETELSNPMFSDAPELLLRAVIGSAQPSPPSVVKPLPSMLGRNLVDVAVKAMERRERGRDASMRITHELRLTLREWGRRLAKRGVLDSADDVHYLSADEVYYPPANAKDLVIRRRAERDRLARLDYPVHFSSPWTPEDSRPGTQADLIIGQAVSAGVARGRVRIMVHADDDFEPGEVLVANVTDTGWTAFFGCAAAVVTNVGGPMSHAAIVAREFGIPAVVNAVGATQQLKDGQLVEVDGTTGIIRVIDEAVDTKSVDTE